MAAYEEDLAYVHDAGFTELAGLAAAALTRALGPRSPGRVVELGCGGGVTARALADAGLAVRGIDISAAQIALARERAPGAEFEVGSIHDADLGHDNDAIVAVGEVLNYAFDDRSSEDALAELFARARRALKPSGLLLFDSAGPGRVPGGHTKGFEQSAEWAVLFEAREGADPPEVVRDITCFRRANGGWRRSRERHRLLLYEPERLRAMLADAGFDVEVQPGYADERFAPGLDVFVARPR